ncbi:hypothetical protein BGZ94_005991, partial [Podila epigama]
MEEMVYQIWTVLSAFEESSAGCISEMLLHVSNGAYYDGVQMAERFILHVEILFSAIDDLELQMREAGDPNGKWRPAIGNDPGTVIVGDWTSSLPQSSDSDSTDMCPKTGKYTITEREHHSTTVISRFLSKLMELANKDKCLQDLHGKGAVDADATSDLCFACRITIENECFTFEHVHRWHPKCLVCSECATPLADKLKEANFDSANGGSVLCQGCRTPTSSTGFLHVTKLEQYTFLLRVALVRLENLLKLK